MTPLAFQVLRRIADGRFHSGAALARACGVSRGTVWNAMRAIEGAGVTLYKVRGRGYRLARPLAMLDAGLAGGYAGSYAARFAIDVADRVASTNTMLLARAAAGARAGAVLAAEWQDEGRGRLGRVWHSSLGGALTFSVLWRFEQGAGGLGGLSLVAGLAVARALDALGACDVTLKWPNDVLWRSRKLGGLLIEMRGDASGPSTAVIGIGLNVHLSDAVRSRIAQPAADLVQACGAEPDRNRVLGLVLAALGRALDAYAGSGFGPLRREWERRHAHQDGAVTIAFPDGRVESGVARGVRMDGALVLETARGVRHLHSGEVTLRSDPSVAVGHAAAIARREA